MSLVSKGYKVRGRIYDASGKNHGGFSFDVVGADIATAKTNAQSIIAALVALTEGVLGQWSITETFVEDGPLTAPAGVQAENRAHVNVRLENDNKQHTFKIPAPIPGLFVATQGEDSNVVDTTNASLISFVELFTDKTGYTVPGADAIALVSDGEKVKPNNTTDTPYILNGKRVHTANTNG